MCRQIIVYSLQMGHLLANQKTTGKYWHGFVVMLYLPVKRRELILKNSILARNRAMESNFVRFPKETR